MKTANLAFRLKMAKQKAEAVLREDGITALAVNPIKIAESREIIVEPKPDAEEGVSGMLVRYGDVFGIMYATHIKNEGFQNFSIAHELGHYFLEGHLDHVLPRDGEHASRAGFVSADPYELEADHFAAGLLMPSGPFRKALGKTNAGLGAVEMMAGICKTSLTATAIRYAELAEDAVAVIVSTGPAIDFCCLSETMKSLKQLAWLKKGSSVPAKTLTVALNGSPERVRRADRADTEIDIMDWLGGVRSVRATEEVIGLGRYGKTLTVLTCPSLVDEIYQEDDADDEEKLIDRWTPRFHR